jgi:type I restriction enzyme S subunit
MKFVKLGDIVTIKKGKKPVFSEFPNEKSVRFLQIGDLRNDNNLKFTDEKTGVLVDADDVLLAWDGANAGTIGYGKTGYIGSTIAVLKKKNSKDYSTVFIGKFLQSQFEYLRSKATGATIPHIDRKSLDSLKLPVIDFTEQIRIAEILTQAENLITQRKESIALLDELLKSAFLEMFGDPVQNEKEWDLFTVIEIGETRLGKMLDQKKIIGNNLKPYLRNSNVLWFNFKLDDLLEMDFDEKDKWTFSLQNGDILMCEGGEIGRCAIWKNDLLECYFQKAIHRIRLKINLATPEYFVYMFSSYSINGGLNKFKSAATISHLTGENLKKMNLPIPPIELQNQFTAIVKKVDGLRKEYQASLKELENMYEALSQKAFKGELKIK